MKIEIECSEVIYTSGSFRMVSIEAPSCVEPAYVILDGAEPVSVEFTREDAEADWNIWVK